jgi:hypothetical protein
MESTDVPYSDLLEAARYALIEYVSLPPEKRKTTLIKLEEAAEKAATEKPEAKNTSREEPSTLEKIVNHTVVKSMARTAGNTIVRSLLGALGLGGRTTRKKSNWF